MSSSIHGRTPKLESVDSAEPSAETSQSLSRRALKPGDLLDVVRKFIEEYFKCMYCRRHFLEQFDNGSYGLAFARRDPAQAVLYFWRLHSAVSVRVASEHGCNTIDRRWPP